MAWSHALGKCQDRAVARLEEGPRFALGTDFVLDDLSFRSVSSSTPPPQVAIGTAVEVSWPSVAGQLYQVQWALALDAHQWFSLGPLVAGDGKTVAVYDPLGTNSRRFYRVIPVD